MKLRHLIYSLTIGALALASGFSQAVAASGTLLPPIDLSPGFDVPGPSLFALNRTTHRLYAFGSPDPRTATTPAPAGLKVIDSATNTVIGGFSLGSYPDGSPFFALAMAFDESAAPAGNKLYIVAAVSSRYVLRVVDAATETNLTGPGTDIILPVAPDDGIIDQASASEPLVVNSSNHKVYIATAKGQIIVVDGVTRQIVRILNPNAGSFLALDPVANKIFVLGENGGAIIDCQTDSVSPPAEPVPFAPTAAVYNEADGLIYGTASDEQNGRYDLFALDARSGTMVRSRSRTDSDGFVLGDYVTGMAVVPGENTLYLGSYRLLAFNTTDLSHRGTVSQEATRLAWDPANAETLFAIPRRFGFDEGGPATLHTINRSSGQRVSLTTASVPGRIAVNSRTNRIYVLDARTPELVVVDGRDRSVIARVELPSAGGHLAVSEQLNRIYLTSGVVVDGSTNQVHSSSEASGRFLAIDDTRRRLYASVGQNTVGRFSAQWFLRSFDTDAAAFLSSLSLGTYGPDGGQLAANPVTGRVYLTVHATSAFSSSRFFVIDGAASQLVTSTADVPGAEGGIGINRRTNDIYIPQQNGNIIVFDGATDRIETSFPAGGNGPDNPSFTGIVVDEEADTVTVTELASTRDKSVGRILTYEAHNNHALVGEMQVGNPAAGLAFNPVTRQFFVPNLNDGTVTVIQADGTAARNQFGNLSTRLQVGGSDDVMISGVIVNAPAGATKKVIVRAVGPSLGALGVRGALADTTLELHTAAGEVITNDNWKIDDATQASQQSEIEATGLAPSDDREAAIIAELPAGAHTAVIRGKGGATGVGLAEVFTLGDDSPAALANIATRGRVGTGEDVMIAGMIVKGTNASRVLVRAIGPSLQGKLAGALQNPVLELRDINGGLIAVNDDWRSDRESEIAGTTIPPNDDKESAILADLFPGNYTAIVSGAGDTMGVAVVEAYKVQ